MTPLKTLTRTTTLVLCASVFAGTALAGEKPADGAPGNSGNAPGQEKKAEPAPQPTPAAPAAAPVTPPGQAKKAEPKPATPQASPTKAAKPTKPAKADKPAKAAKSAKAAKPAKLSKAAKPAKPAGSGSYKATSSGDDLKNDLDHKHTICHATGSATNPYVVITPSISGVHHGHVGHQDGEDIVPPYTYKGQTYSQNWDAAGQALFANGCRPAAAQTATTTATTTSDTTTTNADCPGTTRTVTEVTRGGVFHKTGNGYVFIQPSLGSAHYDASKHADDIVVADQTVTRTVQVPGDCSAASATTGATTTVTLQGQTVTIPGTTTTVAGTTVTIPGQTVTVGGDARVETPAAATTGELEAGGVLGAQSPGSGPDSGAPAEAGGVLGAVASLGQTATTGSLPFTGIPLWIAALIGGGLLAAGFALRRTA